MPAEGELFAFPWGGDGPGDPDHFRVMEVARVVGERIELWAYRERFERPPAAVDPDRLERIGLHELMDGRSVGATLVEWASWKPLPVRRVMRD